MADADTGVSGIQDVFVQVMRSTVVYNRAPTCGGLIGAGDGFYVQESNGGQGLIAYGNSIVLGNSRSINGELVGDDCSSDTPNSDFYSLDGNVIDPEDSCPTFGFDASASFAFSVVSPRQNNAYSPDPAGPAVDLPEAAINCDLSAPDQLGNPRAAGPGQGGVLCDAGAVELQPVGFEYTLQVTTDGSGTITSIPAGIDCPGTCAADFPAGSDVELLQMPAAGFAFDSWTGDCSGDDACTLTMDGARSVTAIYAQQNSLTVSVTGSGAVTSTPAGIDCPGNCSAGFLPSGKVVLTPQAAVGASFVQWGGDCSGDGVCVVAMDADRQVTAIFESDGFALRVVLEGEGAGEVFEVPVPGTIDCPGTCSATYPDGTVVTLEFSAGPDSSFQGFGGECSGTACTVTLDRDRVVRGTFLSAEQLFIDSFEF